MEDFFVRQPLLFEPDHAFNFRLLAYQQSIKQTDQSRLGVALLLRVDRQS